MTKNFIPPNPAASRWGRPWVALAALAVIALPIGPMAVDTAAAAESLGGKEPPRAARSVHLGWPAPDAELFLLDMVVEESTPGSYYMACGWDTGYFGIQELGRGRKVGIFSVWDPTAGDDPKAVKAEDRVELLHEAPGVRIKRFGGEGTGGQCMLDFDWEIGGTNRFLVRGRPDGSKTSYEGWLWMPKKSAWEHLVTFRTRTGGRPLKGLYSFVEDFRRDGASVGDRRRARFGNGWVRTVKGEWMPLTRARFTASGADWEARDGIDAGPTAGAPGWFWLHTGGDVSGAARLRTVFESLPAGVQVPVEFAAPKAPDAP